MTKVAEIIFQVEACATTVGFVARWDAPAGGGITTQNDSQARLDSMILDAVEVYFEKETRPAKIRLHFMQDPLLTSVWELTE